MYLGLQRRQFSPDRNTATSKLTTLWVLFGWEHVATPDIPHRNCGHNTCKPQEQILQEHIRQGVQVQGFLAYP